jgi:hypothetical protein
LEISFTFDEKGFEPITLKEMALTDNADEFFILVLIKVVKREIPHSEFEAKMGCSGKHVRDVIKSMENRGLLRVEHGRYYVNEQGKVRQETNRYTIGDNEVHEEEMRPHHWYNTKANLDYNDYRIYKTTKDEKLIITAEKRQLRLKRTKQDFFDKWEKKYQLEIAKTDVNASNNEPDDNDDRSTFFQYMNHVGYDDIDEVLIHKFSKFVIKENTTYEVLLHAYKIKADVIKKYYKVKGLDYVLAIIKNQIPESTKAIKKRHEQAEKEKNLPPDIVIDVTDIMKAANEKEAAKPKQNRVLRSYDMDELEASNKVEREQEAKIAEGKNTATNSEEVALSPNEACQNNWWLFGNKLTYQDYYIFKITEHIDLIKLGQIRMSDMDSGQIDIWRSQFEKENPDRLDSCNSEFMANNEKQIYNTKYRNNQDGLKQLMKVPS